MAGSTTELTGDLEAGRAAFERRDWASAVEHLGAADRAGELGGTDLERLGVALWWIARPDDSTDALERAFNAYEEAGQTYEAASVAISLAYQAITSANMAAGGAWQSQAGRLLAELPEGPLHARRLVYASQAAIYDARLDDGIRLADEAMEIARRHDDPNWLNAAMSFKGLAQVFSGRLEEGQKNLDAAAAAVSTGKLDLRVASDI